MQSWVVAGCLGTAATPAGRGASGPRQDAQPRVPEVADGCSRGEASPAGMLLPRMGRGGWCPEVAAEGEKRLRMV